MKTEDSMFVSAVNAKIAAVAGVVLLLFSCPFVIFGALGTWMYLTDGMEGPGWLIGAFLFVGAFCAILGIRLIFGIRRADSGLMSPFVLRSSGLVFATVPVFVLASEGIDLRSIWLIIKLGTCFAAAGACFTLASRREQLNAKRR